MLINFSTFTSATAVNNLGTASLGLNLAYTNSPPNNNNLPTLSTLNGNSTLSFTGIGDSVLLNSSSLSFTYGSTYIALVNPTITTTSGQQRILTLTGNISFGFYNLNPLFTTTGILDYQASLIVTSGTWNILVYRLNTNGSIDFSINGNQTYLTVTGPTTALGTTTGINLACYSSGSQSFIGQIAGIWCFNTVLTNTQVNGVVGEIAWFYGVQSILNSGNPNVSSRPWVRSASLNLSSNRIINSSDPVNLQDASTQNYVNNYVATAIANTCLKVDGTSVPIANINLGNNRLINLANPVSNTDAVNLQYLQSNTLNTTGTNVYRILFTAASVTGYTVNLL
jgi:hypothetical protein